MNNDLRSTSSNRSLGETLWSIVFALARTPPVRWAVAWGDALGETKRPAMLACCGLVIAVMVFGLWTAVDAYRNYTVLVERRLEGSIFADPAQVYAAPRVLNPGDRADVEGVIESLERAGFARGNPEDRGAYDWDPLRPSHLVVSPTEGGAYALQFSGGRLVRAVEVETGFRLDRVELPPERITMIHDDSRTKRRLLEPDEIPQALENAIIAAEDRRFLNHFGVDPVRVAGAAWSNLWGSGRQGASTLTMQLAGSVFLDRSQRTWGRKLPETVIALLVERALTKEEILGLYVNEIYLGHRGSFAIHGFGEAAAAYFGKDVEDLTLSEIAILVGMLPAPNAYAPTRDMDAAVGRRELVLAAMVDAGFIEPDESEKAADEPVAVVEKFANAGLAPYMVDYVRGELLRDFDEQDLVGGGLRIHTTIDPVLQRAAAAAVANGVGNVEELLAARDRGPGSGEPPVQAALVVLDPHSGEIKAMVGGRDYGSSQYNRIVEAFRQPGSVFKPFVYAAAVETAFDPLPRPEFGRFPALGSGVVFDLDAPSSRRFGPRDAGGDGTLSTDRSITSVTTVLDAPTEFHYGRDEVYAPDNYGSVFHGVVTVREALQRSLNVPAVKIAERVGYDRVAGLAGRAGLNGDIQPFPSIALGAFEVTPLEIAGAWTMFANEGVRVVPRGVRQVEAADGTVVRSYPMESHRVVRGEVAAVMTELLANVVDRGTGAGVRARGFTLPAAGKTGTSRDGWFAGYTSGLLAVAWVGFDDGRELGIDGSRSALPIWTEFMLAAAEQDPPRGEFVPGPGVELVAIDPATGALASSGCPDAETHAFVRGTAPDHFCPIHGPGRFSLPGFFEGIGRSISRVFD